MNKKTEGINEWIYKQLDFNGGGSYSIDVSGLYHIDYCYNESTFKIWKTNLKLFFMWLGGKR